MRNASEGSQWLEVDSCIKRWRGQRDNLISELETGVILTHLNVTVSGRKPPASRRFLHHVAPHREIRQLCEQMMDYLSAGHFEMYRKLLEEGAHLNGRARHLIRSIYRHIEASTDQALTFNDKYDGDEASIDDEATLPQDVARLSLAMKERFDLEDQLISLLHESQRPLSTASEHC